jgi:hypothetical protein
MQAKPAEHTPVVQGSAHTLLPTPNPTQLLDKHSTPPAQDAPSSLAGTVKIGEPAACQSSHDPM